MIKMKYLRIILIILLVSCSSTVNYSFNSQNEAEEELSKVYQHFEKLFEERKYETKKLPNGQELQLPSRHNFIYCDLKILEKGEKKIKFQIHKRPIHLIGTSGAKFPIKSVITLSIKGEDLKVTVKSSSEEEENWVIKQINSITRNGNS